MSSRSDQATAQPDGMDEKTQAVLHASADPHFVCDSCGYQFELPAGLHPVMGMMPIVVDADGNELPGVWRPDPGAATAAAPCRRCGQLAPATNAVGAMNADFAAFTGFANSPAQAAAYRVAVAALGHLHGDATLEQVTAILEVGGLGPVATYLRDHHLELAALGVSLASIVITLMQMLIQSQGGESPQPPTYDQMERLFSELRDDLKDETGAEHGDRSNRGRDGVRRKAQPRPQDGQD